MLLVSTIRHFCTFVLSIKENILVALQTLGVSSPRWQAWTCFHRPTIFSYICRWELLIRPDWRNHSTVSRSSIIQHWLLHPVLLTARYRWQFLAKFTDAAHHSLNFFLHLNLCDTQISHFWICQHLMLTFFHQIYLISERFWFGAHWVASLLKFGGVSARWIVTVIVLESASVRVFNLISSTFLQYWASYDLLFWIRIVFKAWWKRFVDDRKVLLVLINNLINFLCIFSKILYIILINDSFMVILYLIELNAHFFLFSTRAFGSIWFQITSLTISTGHIFGMKGNFWFFSHHNS